ncbi:N-formylglutamate amidohydrolase [Demequina sp. NBRC 110056]|uniref:N-formylglutamate amidohydrolase n=1 Tax=Demequina sp. NBRC 110056 TaxID=1570345 RepID=UPI000A063A46|nr:N-formylglutamate amidohydrolase [Demequina sp. NBRC 110056]
MTSPVVLHIAHASRVVPADARAAIVLSEAELERELDHMTDSFTDVIARRTADVVGASGALTPVVVEAPVSRLVVDVERFTDGSEPMEAVGMGPVYTRTHDQRVLRATVDPAVLDRYCHPHAQAVEDAVTSALAKHHHAVVIDVHSYPKDRLPYEMSAADAARPEICIGSDATHTPPWLLAAARTAFAGFEVGLDSPFAGTYVPLRYYRVEPRVVSVMVEIRRDQYVDEEADEVHDGLARVVDALAALCRAAGRSEKSGRPLSG